MLVALTAVAVLYPPRPKSTSLRHDQVKSTGEWWCHLGRHSPGGGGKMSRKINIKKNIFLANEN